LLRHTGIKHITVKSKALPPDLGKNSQEQIAFILDKKHYNNLLQKFVSTHYHGPYELVTFEEYRTEKYSNKTVFRYAFTRESVPDPKGSTYLFHVTDELRHITYNSPVHSYSYKGILEAYIINLEKLRSSNEVHKTN